MDKNKKLPKDFMEALKTVVEFIDDADNKKQKKLQKQKGIIKSK